MDVLEILDIKYLLGKPKLNISCLLSWLKINCLNRKIKRATIHSSGKYDFKVKLYSEVYVFDCFTRNLRFSSRWESITNYHEIKSFHRYFISAFVCLYGFFCTIEITLKNDQIFILININHNCIFIGIKANFKKSQL